MRGPEEFNGEIGCIPGARNVPQAELSNVLAELSRIREHELAFVCRTQIRSVRAANTLVRAGFRNLTVLRSGMEEWNHQGFEIAHDDHPTLETRRHHEDHVHPE